MPSVSVLQLDTTFPRIAGDVGCAETYVDDIEILRVPGASVGKIVSADPATIPIGPFEYAITQAQGDIIVTSCGFLSYWQTHLAALTNRPFISSALTALPDLCACTAAQNILTVTFDADSLNERHFGAHRTDIIGLAPDMHLRRVISQNRATLDVARATKDTAGLISAQIKAHHTHILLECTNLPPYKHAIAQHTTLPITDILTCIEAVRAGTIKPAFL